MAPNSKAIDPALDGKQVDKALNDLERMIEQLKRDYESFFAGGLKRPPIDLRASIESSVRRFSSIQTLNNAQRFRYSSLAARFLTYAELWNRQIRLREEGKIPGAAVAAASGSRLQNRPPQKTEDTRLKDLFKSYAAAKSTAGEANAFLNYDNFLQALSKQREQIIKQHQCKDVEFYLAEENGRTKLKAKVIK